MRKIGHLLFATLSLAFASSNYSATPVNLRHTLNTNLQMLLAETAISTINISRNSVKEISREKDAKGMLHVHVQQYYQGIPVWQGHAIFHTPAHVDARSSSLIATQNIQSVHMNGIFYQGLDKDLATLSTSLFSQAQQLKAINYVSRTFYVNSRLSAALQQQVAKPIIFTDKQNKAHPAFLVSFVVKEAHRMPQNPHYIIDAATWDIYQAWDEVKTMQPVKGGGVGGNEGLIGKILYDGGPDHFPALTFSRDMKMRICYLANTQLTVIDDRTTKIPHFSCKTTDPDHYGVYWNTLNDYENGGYSPNIDAVYSDYIVRKMYQDWFDITMLRQYPNEPGNNTPWHITMITHIEDAGQNAWWNNGEMGFGNGDAESYPVVAPSVVAHELSHGFTEQHAQLVYHEESGGLNESFSDMADKAVEYYVYNKNTWTIDPELLKPGGRLLRYMDDPTQDCAPNQKPGNGCSIASYKDYHDKVGVHFSSGIFNRVFYLLANSNGWNTKKAFEIMVHANQFYWTPTTTFHDAACGVIDAARYYHYELQAIKDAFKQVDIDVNRCNT